MTSVPRKEGSVDASWTAPTPALHLENAGDFQWYSLATGHILMIPLDDKPESVTEPIDMKETLYRSKGIPGCPY